MDKADTDKQLQEQNEQLKRENELLRAKICELRHTTLMFPHIMNVSAYLTVFVATMSQATSLLAALPSTEFYLNLGFGSRTRAAKKSLQATKLMFAAKMDRIHSIFAMIFSNIPPRPGFVSPKILAALIVRHFNERRRDPGQEGKGGRLYSNHPWPRTGKKSNYSN
jgi:hypothetical protein